MLARHADPILAVATAPGRGAVGIVRVSGRGLDALTQALCGRVPRAREAAYLGFLDDDGSPIDHGLALRFEAPHSYTGEDVLELQAHGGPVVLQLLVARCLRAASQTDPASGRPVLKGLRLAGPGEFTERAFLNNKIDLAQAEAVADLIDASTEAAARGAARSLSGDFSREIATLSAALVELRMLVEATLDFPEEDIDHLSRGDAHGRLRRASDALDAVLDRARQGALLREGIRIVIAGQPNAGKSSLLNALAGAELAIVTPVPGTTRDKVQQTIQIEGVPVHVVDTAGLRDTSDEVERIGVERAWAEIRQADVVLFLHDLTRLSDAGYQAGEDAIRATLPTGHTVLDVYNKTDVAPTSDVGAGPVGTASGDLAASAMPGSMRISARDGQGLDALRQRILDLAGWHAVPEGAFIARERHLQALQRTRMHLDQAAALLAQPAPALDLIAEELRLAHQSLGEITGAFSADDLLGEIFSRFCIGK